MFVDDGLDGRCPSCSWPIVIHNVTDAQVRADASSLSTFSMTVECDHCRAVDRVYRYVLPVRRERRREHFHQAIFVRLPFALGRMTAHALWFLPHSIMAAAVVAFLLTLRTEPSLAIALNYGAIPVFSGGLMLWIRRRRPGTHRLALAGTCVAISAVLIGVHRHFDYYDHVWDTTDYRYIDRRTRVADRVIHRHIVRLTPFPENDDSTVMVASGPMGGEGFPTLHGRWEYVFRAEDGLPMPEDAWYWYGEMVSEGEWHRLNSGR